MLGTFINNITATAYGIFVYPAKLNSIAVYIRALQSWWFDFQIIVICGLNYF